MAVVTKISDEFHKHYEENKLWANLRWLGIPMWKLPFDAIIVQNLISQIQPDYIIETGTGMGGASAFYATICEALRHGKVITVDIENKHKLQYIPSNISERISFIQASSTDTATVVTIYNRCNLKKNLVILDSWHTEEHVFKELQLYSDLVPVGSYIIVEDSHVSGHPIEWRWGKGPYEAIHDFLGTDKGKNFVIDRECENQVMTFNPDGFLRRIK